MGTFSGGPLRTWNLSRSGWSGVFWGERQENHFCTVLKLHAADFLACLSFMLLLCVFTLDLSQKAEKQCSLCFNFTLSHSFSWSSARRPGSLRTRFLCCKLCPCGVVWFGRWREGSLSPL